MSSCFSVSYAFGGLHRPSIIPDRIMEAPHVIRETYQLRQSMHTVSSGGLPRRSMPPKASPRSTLYYAAVASVRDRFDSSVLEEALSRVLSPVI